jgi:hypothetical protein
MKKTNENIVELTLPVSEPVSNGGFGATLASVTHIDMLIQSNVQKVGLLYLKTGLIAAGERLANGRKIETNSDVVRYVMEKIGEAC